MDLGEIQTIDAVIEALGRIIQDAKIAENPMGYFPALYQKVTIKVKEGIAEGFFENGPRMERLDVVFAKRYLQAYQDYKTGNPVTQSWEKTFLLTKDYWPIVLQHLLMGMNAHINLDLGIAAAEISTPEDIHSLSTDFKRINEVLASLVREVQEDLATIWPKWHWILKKTGHIDNHLIDFSMEIARDGAWQFAERLVQITPTKREAVINERDLQIADLTRVITNPGWWVEWGLCMIRLGEKGTAAAKIEALQAD